MKFTITKEDYEASAKDYSDNTTCAMVMAARRQLDIPAKSTVVCGYKTINVNGQWFAEIKKPFSSNHHRALEHAVQNNESFVFETETIEP